MEAAKIAAAARSTAESIVVVNAAVQSVTPSIMTDAVSRMLAASWERFAFEVEKWEDS